MLEPILATECVTCLQLSELFAAIDAVRDPWPDQARLAKTWIRSNEKKKGDPPLSQTLATRVRSWMVRTELLLQNPDWFESGRVAHSGMAWGEEEEEPKELVKDRKGKGKAGSKKLFIRLPRPRVNDGEAEATMNVIVAAQNKIGEILDGADNADMLFN